jgi:integrase
VTGVKRPALPPGRSRRVATSEADLLLSTADHVPPRGGRPAGRGMKAIITLGLETSMREGELIGLKWKHIDFGTRVAHLPKTKNGESRSVALSSKAICALKQMQALLRDDGKVFDWANSGSFAKKFSSLVRRARKLYEGKCQAEGVAPDVDFLTNIRFHDLRHEATSRLFEVGLNPMEVASMTGHKSMQMLKRYTHVEASKVAAKLT